MGLTIIMQFVNMILKTYIQWASQHDALNKCTVSAVNEIWVQIPALLLGRAILVSYFISLSFSFLIKYKDDNSTYS